MQPSPLSTSGTFFPFQLWPVFVLGGILRDPVPQASSKCFQWTVTTQKAEEEALVETEEVVAEDRAEGQGQPVPGPRQRTCSSASFQQGSDSSWKRVVSSVNFSENQVSFLNYSNHLSISWARSPHLAVGAGEPRGRELHPSSAPSSLLRPFGQTQRDFPSLHHVLSWGQRGG